ncbi:NADH oxidase [Gammaproteobacteria bacterium 45_16_T64]|nr:NADH oxidase [Gammaproteobacteria bacterium 45_16_T64]
MSDTVNIASPITLNNGVTIKNRFFKSAMSEQQSTKALLPHASLARLYSAWAQGGVGLIVTGNVMIAKDAMGEPRQVVLEKGVDLAPFSACAKAGTENGAHIWMQLNHPGKQIPKFLNKQPVAPSAIPLERGLEKIFNTPRALTELEIEDIIRRFTDSAVLAKEAGFSGVQIHGAHGYLVSQFLSPRHNRRTDQWGGNAENRMRFVLEIYKAMRAAVGDHYPIGIKLNSADFMKDGFSEDDSMAVVEKLSEVGMNLIEISGGTYESPEMMGKDAKAEPQKESTKKREAYFLDYAEKVRQHTASTLVVTGGFRSGVGMNDALSSGATDMIGIARPLAVYPDLVNRFISDPTYVVDIKRPTTGSKLLDMAAMLDISWFEQQMHRIGHGKPLKPNLSPLKAAMGSLLSTGVHAFKQRRA